MTEKCPLFKRCQLWRSEDGKVDTFDIFGEVITSSEEKEQYMLLIVEWLGHFEPVNKRNDALLQGTPKLAKI